MCRVEAMLCGTPVVATDFPGGRQAVHLTGMGRIVPPRDSTALAEALLAVLQNPGQYTKPRAEIERVFNYARAIDLHEELYRSNRIVQDDRAFERANASHEAGQELKMV